MTRQRLPRRLEIDRKLLASTSLEDFGDLESEVTAARDTIESILFWDAMQEDRAKLLPEAKKSRLESDLLRINELLADLLGYGQLPARFVFIESASYGREVWGDTLACRNWTKILLAARSHGSLSKGPPDGRPPSGIDTSKVLLRLIPKSRAADRRGGRLSWRF
jgi:hypothetical protein